MYRQVLLQTYARVWHQYAVVKWLEKERQGFTTNLKNACTEMTKEFAARRRNNDINDHAALSEKAMRL